LSSKTLSYASGIIRRHLKSIGSRWRKLNPGQQALLVLAYLKKDETFAEVAAGREDRKDSSRAADPRGLTRLERFKLAES
jgi:hypothetical protein